jgi:hypothetical protein
VGGSVDALGNVCKAGLGAREKEDLIMNTTIDPYTLPIVVHAAVAQTPR